MKVHTIDQLNLEIEKDAIISESVISFVLGLLTKLKQMRNNPTEIEKLANELTEHRLELATTLYQFLKTYGLTPKIPKCKKVINKSMQFGFDVDLTKTFIYVIDTSLGMSKGKIAAQVSHVAMMLVSDPEILGRAIVLKADHEYFKFLCR